MKWCAALILLAVLAAAMPGTARAQAEDFLGLPGPEQPEELKPQEKLDRTRYANMYYERCVTVRAQDISPATRDETCMCHAVHMLQHLKTPELEVMGTGKGTLNVNPKRLYPMVYAPCLEFGVRDVERDWCYNARPIHQSVTTQENFEALCDCLAEGTAQLMRETAEVQMAAMVEARYYLGDPLDTIMGSVEYTRERAKILGACINQYGG